MVRLLLTAAALLPLLPAGARAGYGYGSGPPQAQHAVAQMKDGQLTLREFVLTHEQRTATRQRKVKDAGGKEEIVPETFTYTVAVPRAVLRTIDAAKVRAVEADGTKVGAAALASRLEKETHVLFTEEGRKPNATLLKILKKGTLILTLPRRDDRPRKVVPPSKTGKVVETAFQPEPVPAPGEAARGPRSLPPLAVAAGIDEKGVVYVRDNSGNAFTSTGYYEVEEGGQKRLVPVQIKENVFTLRTRSLDARAVRAFRTDGKPVPAADLPRLLRKEVTVLVSADGRKVDPFYLEVIRAGTPVLVLPAPAFHGAPPAIPAPPPPKVPAEDLKKSPA